MAFRVAIAGASGYVGGELLRLLAAHPDIEIGVLTASSSAGQPLVRVHPSLQGVRVGDASKRHTLGDRILHPTSAEALKEHDVVFLALPHGASVSIASELPEGVLVIDCGADHRLASRADWERWYGGTYAGSWPYGLPEISRIGTHTTSSAPSTAPSTSRVFSEITTETGGGARNFTETPRHPLVGARRIAVPGCYPTATTLALAPAFATHLVEPDVVVVAASGTSGAGRHPGPGFTSAEVVGSMRAYGVGGTHRHTPEIAQNLRGLAGGHVSVSFTPLLAPMTRGIVATASAPIIGTVASGSTSHSPLPSTSTVHPSTTPEVVRAAYEAAYGSEPFVQLLPEGQWPSTRHVYASNMAHVQAALDVEVGRIVAVCAIDNLTKGAAGQAVQCMNIALELPETRGLPVVGVG